MKDKEVEINKGVQDYWLGLVKRDENMYCLVDIATGEWFDKMTIYYINNLITKWNESRDMLS